MPKITRKRDRVTFMSPEDLRAYMADKQFTHATFSESVGASHTTSVYYCNGLSPIPYQIVKLMYLQACYGDTCGPADTRLLKNLDRCRRNQPQLDYMTPAELAPIMDYLDWDVSFVADKLGYMSGRAVTCWLEGITKMKYCDAKIIQYLAEIPQALELEIPGADDVFRLRKQGKAPIFVPRKKGEPETPVIPSFLE